MRPPSECPVCGAAVPPKAKACPECGADERSGWNEDDTRYDGLDLPESAYEDDDSPAPRRRPVTSTGIHPFWWIVAALLLLVWITGLIVR
jgi:hypothetical protein